ncbi:VOC family protein [Pedobacter sandarakinus]|uniref:glyoxalase n=1 Tax=Pedobacter sandarakinus TaxID=353156 RepID=UPI002245DA0D|nr:glyoxalase [Pedobacter sandarakinus]MCX2576234.1 glyoxalase [Pedobacter sandarakinus]
MNHYAKSIRPFIGAKSFETSRSFYRDLGFEETKLGEQMSVFKTGNMAFYLQNYYLKDWIENTMIFMEVEDVNLFYSHLLDLDLPSKYKGVKLTPIRNEEWGSECFLHDPAGNLWHFGAFK